MSVILNPFQLLELHVISAQDLARVSRNMRPYAIAWIHPDRKLSTRIDPHGKTNPTWNDRFVFKVDEEFLLSETSAVTIEIYSVHWLKDILVGSVRVLIGNLLPPQRSSRPFRRQRHVGMQFAALQIRRPSGRPQGIINVGISLLDSSSQSMPLNSEISTTLMVTTGTDQGWQGSMVNGDNNEKRPQELNGDTSLPAAIQPVLRRSKSESSSMDAMSDGSKLKRKVSFRERLHSIISASEGSSSQDQKLIKGSSSTPASMVNGYYVSHPNETTNQDKVGESSKASTASMLLFGGSPSAVKITELKTELLVVDHRDPNKGETKQQNLEKVVTESDLGLSPSEVAAAATSAKERHPYRAMAPPPPPPDEVMIMEGSVVSMSESMEGLQSKLERWRMELPPIYDRSDVPSFSPSMLKSGASIGTKGGHGHRRGHTEGDGDGGLFSCFSNICGCECSIVCGGGKNKTSSSKGRSHRGRRRSHSPTSDSFL